MKGADIWISESEAGVLERALRERGREWTSDQDEADFAEPYDEIAATLNVLITRYRYAR